MEEESNRRFRYGSVCSGVEAASLAWRGLGWEPAFFSEIEPFPCAVLKERFPSVPNLGDMTKISVDSAGTIRGGDGTEVHGGIDLLVGGTPCFVAGTRILTDTGYRPIEELRVGDLVVTDRWRLRRIVQVGSKSAETVEARIVGRLPIRVTPNHPFLTSERKSPRKPFSDPEYRPISESAGRHALLSDALSECAMDLPKKDFPELCGMEESEVARLVGWYLATGRIGSVRGKTAVVFRLTPARLAKFRARFIRAGLVFSRRKCANGSVLAQVENEPFAAFLADNFGSGARGLRIPAWCYASPLRRYICEGFGETSREDYRGGLCRHSTASKALALGIADLEGKTCVCPTRDMRSYCVQSAAHAIKFVSVAGRTASKVAKVTPTGLSEEVFNIEVEEDHTYVADGVFVHNCQSFSNAGNREGLKGASGLAYHFIRLLREIRPRWFVWENVPGAFSSRTDGQLDFNFLMRSYAECGYSVGWRVLDAQYVRTEHFPLAVPQRRRRVFAVGYLGTDFDRVAEVLFVGEGLCGYPPPRRVKGQGTAAHTLEGPAEPVWADGAAGVREDHGDAPSGGGRAPGAGRGVRSGIAAGVHEDHGDAPCGGGSENA